jgi:hypothetical protein
MAHWQPTRPINADVSDMMGFLRTQHHMDQAEGRHGTTCMMTPIDVELLLQSSSEWKFLAFRHGHRAPDWDSKVGRHPNI